MHHLRSKENSDGNLSSETIGKSLRNQLPLNAIRTASLDEVSNQLAQPHINAVITPSKRPALSSLSEEAQRQLLEHPISLYSPRITPKAKELQLESIQKHLFPTLTTLSETEKYFLQSLQEEIFEFGNIISTYTGNHTNLLITSNLLVGSGWHYDVALAATYKLFGPTTEFIANSSVEIDPHDDSLFIEEDAHIFYPQEGEILFHHGWPADNTQIDSLTKPPLVHRVAERVAPSPLLEKHNLTHDYMITVVASSII